jgi:hypothetical protein
VLVARLGCKTTGLPALAPDENQTNTAQIYSLTQRVPHLDGERREAAEEGPAAPRPGVRTAVLLLPAALLSVSQRCSLSLSLLTPSPPALPLPALLQALGAGKQPFRWYRPFRSSADGWMGASLSTSRLRIAAVGAGASSGALCLSLFSVLSLPRR